MRPIRSKPCHSFLIQSLNIPYCTAQPEIQLSENLFLSKKLYHFEVNEHTGFKTQSLRIEKLPVML